MAAYMEHFYDLHHAKILVVDDIAINRAILDMLICDNNGVTALANDGRKAVELFISSEPGEFALILMDMRMPEMDGITATAAIRSADHFDAKTIPIIALTGEPASEVQDKCFLCGMNLFMEKPFNADELLQAMSKFTQKD